MTRKSTYYSKKTSKEKVKTCTYISKELFEKASKLAIEVYGVQRGGLSYAFEDGLKLWLNHHSGTLMGTHQNPRPRLREIYNAVMRDVSKEFDLMIPNTIPNHTLLKSAMKALNVKNRSAIGWIFKFYVEGLIKPLSPSRNIRLLKPSEIHRVRVWELVAKEA